ncbi:hypothetical protein RZQ20_25630 [Raoultella ornithinolytica]|uniref:hypothetical protein n=1 Tax=Raoultella ornithinolytica TaxID=54291 RepID=UPI00255AF1B7|nr:hypothetical protein [Raoultella ornithinolytica]MDL4585348.1 hypothetical protein [Raoultella ornithinolytica]MDV1095646.1 hypothetical protein [Raoultella ornithinolytica]MDV1123197.1 hypothetical protein [Raoultella ornithinolytica]MDV1893557.1 hypothetical protein [Raoultella ornithinolytica]HEC2564912.1 hypothetical protein [Raoultella ornithinolytica]
MLFPFILTLLCFAVGTLLSVVIFLRREYRRLREDADSIVVRYVNVAERYEHLVRDVTEPYGGVLSGLENVNRLSSYLSCLPEKEHAAAQVTINCLDQWLRILLCPVADRCHLSVEDKHRWLGDDNRSEVRE